MTASITIVIKLGERSLEIRKGGSLRLNRITGVESPEYDVQAEEYSAMEGGYLSFLHVPSRLITMTFTVDNRYETEERRAELIGFFAIDREGELKITRTGVTRVIPCRCAAAPVFDQENIRKDKLKVTVSLLCLFPYFSATVPVEIRFGTVLPLLSFPISFMAGAGVIFGRPEVTDNAILFNDGDVSAGLVMTVKAAGGTIVNPFFYLDNEFVRVLTALEDGDELVIDTRPGKKSIRINGENRLLFDRESTFFSVQPGTHTIRVGAESGAEYASATSEIAYLYNGV